MTSPAKLGLVVGAVIAMWHLLWCLFIVMGWAQPILDLVFWAHMINPVYVVKPFDPRAAMTLIAVTFIIGYFFGFIGAVFWNRLHAKPST